MFSLEWVSMLVGLGSSRSTPEEEKMGKPS